MQNPMTSSGLNSSRRWDIAKSIEATDFVLSQITNKNQPIRLAAIETAGIIGPLMISTTVIAHVL
jgi:hypothetical protein